MLRTVEDEVRIFENRAIRANGQILSEPYLADAILTAVYDNGLPGDERGIIAC